MRKDILRNSVLTTLSKFASVDFEYRWLSSQALTSIPVSLLPKNETSFPIRILHMLKLKLLVASKWWNSDLNLGVLTPKWTLFCSTRSYCNILRAVQLMMEGTQSWREELRGWVAWFRRREVTGGMVELSSILWKWELMNESCAQAHFNTEKPF